MRAIVDPHAAAGHAVYTRTGLSAGTHTIVVTEVSGTYAVLDGSAATSA